MIFKIVTGLLIIFTIYLSGLNSQYSFKGNLPTVETMYFSLICLSTWGIISFFLGCFRKINYLKFYLGYWIFGLAIYYLCTLIRLIPVGLIAFYTNYSVLYGVSYLSKLMPELNYILSTFCFCITILGLFFSGWLLRIIIDKINNIGKK